MKDNREILTGILHTTQMGQTGIRSVMGHAVQSELKQELKDQLSQYDDIEREALRLAKSRGWTLPDINPAIKRMSHMMSRARLMGGEVDSKIAGMLVQGNTRGMILGTKNLNRSSNSDAQITELANRLLDRENINIQKTMPYL